VRLEIGSREEIEVEFPWSEQDKQESERTINNTSNRHGQSRETEFPWSEKDKQEKEREWESKYGVEKKERGFLL
jgi:hypothetical protein